jgi:hypothetical protein
MIQPLRKVHRVTFYLVAAFVPLVFTAALVQRPAEPMAVRPPGKPSELRLDGATMWPSSSIATRCTQGVSGPTVRVEVLKPLEIADPLLYFVTDSETAQKQPSPPNDLPANAVLLGQARDEAVFPLPAQRGRLILYSLGNRKIVDQLAVEVKP